MYDLNPPPRLRNTRPLLFHIPEEILMDDILPRLPVKSLSRFKCVSKPWQSLIESDRFIKIQYRNSAKNPRVIFHVDDMSEMEECSLKSLLNSEEGSDPTKNEEKSGTLVGCCNGVVCFYDHQDWRFWLWNPAIRARIELPDSGGRYIEKCGFGWDESSDAYKVFAVMDESNHTERIFKIYSSNTKSWRTIHGGSPYEICPLGLFLRGSLHWVDHIIHMRHSQIECFDLEREEFGRIELPLNNAAKVPCLLPLLGEIGTSLGVLIGFQKGLEVWVMKEYGVKDSWFKLLTFPHTLSVNRSLCAMLTLFGEGSNGEILVCYAENLMVYSPKEDAISTARNNIDICTARLYVESLVSPKRILEA